ncbi:MAG: hypothetical protein ACLP19_26080 [Xanthobacteraceae bacterium]
MSVENEIADLKRHNAELQRRLAKIEHTLYPPRPAPAEPPRQVTITKLAAVNERFEQPSRAELRELRAIVLQQYPQLRAKGQSDEEALAGFASAFLYLGNVGRADAINAKRELMSWLMDAKIWLRENGGGSTLNGNDLTAAVVAHGDIPYQDLRDYPGGIGFGLGDMSGRPATNAWRAVLTDRRVRPSVTPYVVRRAS